MVRRSHVPLALVALSVAACGSREAGTSVELAAVMHAGRDTSGALPPAASGARSFVTDLGFSVTLDRAHVTISGVELRRCSAPLATRLLRALHPLPAAYAHGTSNPTRSGEPHVVGVTESDADLVLHEMETLAPPTGRYCTLRVFFAPADADAEGLPAGIDMVGKTLELSGEYGAPGSGASTPFTLGSNAAITAELVLPDDAGGTGLELDTDHLHAHVVLGLVYGRWLDGVDMAAIDEADFEVLENVRDSLELVPELPHAH